MFAPDQDAWAGTRQPRDRGLLLCARHGKVWRSRCRFLYGHYSYGRKETVCLQHTARNSGPTQPSPPLFPESSTENRDQERGSKPNLCKRHPKSQCLSSQPEPLSVYGSRAMILNLPKTVLHVMVTLNIIFCSYFLTVILHLL